MADHPAKNGQDKAPARRQGAPACGLYIPVPPGFAVAEMMPKLRELFFVTTRSAYDRNMHALELSHEAGIDDFADRAAVLVALGRAHGFAVILRGKAPAVVELAATLEADGVLLDDPDHLAEARAQLGEQAIIGLRCGLSPERAGEGRDAGADYVTFGYPDRAQLPPSEIISLWDGGDDVPSVVEGPCGNDDVDDYVKAGAGFISAAAYILEHPDGVKQGTVNMLYAIDLALGVRA